MSTAVDNKAQNNNDMRKQSETNEELKQAQTTLESGQDDGEEPIKPNIVEPALDDSKQVKAAPKPDGKGDDVSPKKPNIPKDRSKKNKSKAVKAQRLNAPYLDNTKINKSARSGAVTKPKKAKTSNKSKASTQNKPSTKNNDEHKSEIGQNEASGDKV
jgi:hypothetical protein